MRMVAILCLTVGLGAAGAAFGLLYRDSDKDKGKDKEKDPIAALVQMLGDDDFDKREEASRKLEALGDKAIPALVKGGTSDDLEIRRRARKVLLVLLPKDRKSKSISLELVRINAGSFDVGSPAGEANRRGDETQHRVRLSRPFYLGKYEVTQAEYRQVMKANPSWFSAKGGGKDKVQGLDTDKFPVENVTWFDAVEFCNKLSEKDGLEPYYKLTAVKREGGSITAATVAVAGGRGYRLPTEAEWEYACRADRANAFHFGDRTRAGDLNAKPISVPSGYGSALQWPELGRTAKVGSYRVNAWGLYDMHGNVAEWCHDWYDKDYYTDKAKVDPQGPDKGKHRALRGGSWLVSDGSCRSASRAFLAPEESKYHAGFRVARNP
jgi:formylglycine-generating enzyme required for sulfatase activity